MAVRGRTVRNKRCADGVLSGRQGTVYDVNIKYNSGEGKKTYSKKGFASKKEALRHEAEMRVKLQNPHYAALIRPYGKSALGQYLNDWVENYARVNLRPSTYDGYKRVIERYINPYIGNVPLNQLIPSMVDNMFRQIMEKGLKSSTAAGAKRVLSVALGHARKYRYIETNPVRDTLTKFAKAEKNPDPYTPEQIAALIRRTANTEWEMPVVLGGLYGMRRAEILGLRWRNVNFICGCFSVSEQLPFKMPPKTKLITEMAPPKSNNRILPLTEIAHPFFEKQLLRQTEQKRNLTVSGGTYYDNDLVVAKPDGSPLYMNWISLGFSKLLAELNMPHIRFHDLRHSAATNMHQLSGDFYTVGEILGHTLAGMGASLGLPLNFESVTARYVDVRLERKKEVLTLYHDAVQRENA
jgi:integrase